MKPETEQKLEKMYNRAQQTNRPADGYGFPDPEDLSTVLRREPELTANGIDAKCDTDVDFYEFRAAFIWFGTILEAVRFSKHEYQPSELLRQSCENAIGCFVSNGAVIAAGLLKGLKTKRRKKDVNVEFSLPSLGVAR